MGEFQMIFVPAEAARIVAPIVGGYLLGGVPFGVIVARRFYKVDIIRHGSGSTGATNVLRTIGWKAALFVAILDIAKGAIPTLAALALAEPWWGQNLRDLVAIGAGLAAVAGHSWSPYIRLRGGKGVATAGGMAFALMPVAGAILAPTFVVLVLLFRIVSLSSIISAVLLPVLALVFYGDHPAYVVVSTVVGLLVLWRHRSNMGRLIRGEEPRIDRRSPLGSVKSGPEEGSAQSGEG